MFSKQREFLKATTWNILNLLFMYIFISSLVSQRMCEYNCYRKHCLFICSFRSLGGDCSTRDLWLHIQREDDNNLRDPLTWMILPCQSGKSLTEQMGLKLCPEGQQTVSEQRAKQTVICLPCKIFSFWQKQVSEVQALKSWLTD